MKVCVLSESPADEAAIRVLVEGLYGEPMEFVPPRPIRGRGVPPVLAVFEAVLRHLHYHTDAEALAIVVDSNHGSVHSEAHDLAGAADLGCRFCFLRKTGNDVKAMLRSRSHQKELKLAIGLAVPAIEAWYLCGRNKQVGEATWSNGLSTGRLPYSKRALRRSFTGQSRYH